METVKLFPQPGLDEIFVEVNGLRMSLVSGYTCRAERITEPAGEETGEMTEESVVYTVELVRMLSHGEYNDGINFHELAHFDVTVLKNNMHVRYTDCEWSTITESGSSDAGVLETTVITSKGRSELKF